MTQPCQLSLRSEIQMTRASSAFHKVVSDHPMDISALTRAISQGDEAAFEKFYQIYSRRVYRLALLQASGNEEAAHEVFQRVMIKIVRKIKVLESEPALWAWLSRVTKNEVIDLFRRDAKFNQIAGETNTLIRSEPAADCYLNTYLSEALDSLEKDEQDLIDSIYFQGRTQEDVATEQSQTRKAVESKLARLRAKIREFILRRIKSERTI